MKYLIILLLTFMISACDSTGSEIKNDPYIYGQTAGAIYIIVEDDKGISFQLEFEKISKAKLYFKG